MFIFKARRFCVALVVVFPAAAFCQIPATTTRPPADYFSPTAQDMYARMKRVTTISSAETQRIGDILLKFDEENEVAQRELWQKWYTREAVPTPTEVAAEHAQIADKVARLQDKYFEIVAQQVLDGDHRNAVDAEQLAFRALSAVEATKPQQAKALSIAQEIVQQFPDAPDRTSLHAQRLKSLQVRVSIEILTADQRASLTATTQRHESATPSPATQPNPSVVPASNPAQTQMKYHDNQTVASNAGQVTLSLMRLAQIEPLLASTPPAILSYESRTIWLDMLAEHMRFGDSRAAVVVETAPLLVASYSDDMDAVVILQFPQWLVKEQKLEAGSRLIAVNTFARDHPVGIDIVRGPLAKQSWINVFPVIADFVTDDKDRLRQIKTAITEDEWQRCLTLGQAYRKQFPTQIRNGSPLHSQEPMR